MSGLAFDGLGAIGAYADDGDGALEVLLQIVDVGLEAWGKLGGCGELGQIGRPAWYVFVDGLPTFGVVGHGGGAYAVFFVGYAGADGVEGVEYVGLHHDELGHAVDHNGVAEGYEVYPTAATVATGDGSVFVADVAYLVACLVKELYGEGTAAYACGVGFEDAVDFAYGVGGYAETCAYSA